MSSTVENGRLYRPGLNLTAPAGSISSVHVNTDMALQEMLDLIRRLAQQIANWEEIADRRNNTSVEMTANTHRLFANEIRATLPTSHLPVFDALIQAERELAHVKAQKEKVASSGRGSAKDKEGTEKGKGPQEEKGSREAGEER